jgi:hypothetical protein
MVSRRTWARIQFLTTLLSLPSQIHQWRTAEENGDSVPLALRWLLAGSVFQTIYYWAYDRDLEDIRTNYWRRGLLWVISVGLIVKGFHRSKTVQYNGMIGGYIAGIGYRLWYGVLHPLPGADK